MSIIDKIKADQMTARKMQDSLRATLLTTLFSEIQMLAKNDGNREVTDADAIKVIQKFLKGVNETLGHLKKIIESKTASNVGDTLRRFGDASEEYSILESYLPKMASASEVEAAAGELFANGATNKGQIMKGLREKFGALLDGKLAASVADAILA